jgi:sulfur-carrier protein adenylyltransferase/sulfurtransferase
MPPPKRMFTPVPDMPPPAVKAFMEAHRTSEFMLLDVRQPIEYQNGRIPGAKLLPLSQLEASIRELDPDRNIIVYCASGNRSRVAAQFLIGRGFKKIYNVPGGFNAWQGRPATGPRAFGLEMVRGDETPAEVLGLLYRMEKGLQDFYLTAGEQALAPEVVALLTTLATIEKKHQQKIQEL